MKKNDFKLSAITISVIVGLSSTAIAATSPIAVKDVAGLSKNASGYYTGGGAVHIGGSDINYSKEGVQGNYWWENINSSTPGYAALHQLAGYKDSSGVAGNDVNYPLNESDYQRVVHGERLMTMTGSNAHSTPVGVVSGLKMGTENSRYQKVQNISLYQVDSAGQIVYQKDADGNLVHDNNGHPVPLVVSNNSVVLDRNSDVYIKRQERVGGQFGLKDSAIYSKVQSFQDTVAAVTMKSNLRETVVGSRDRDVFVVNNTVIDNTLNTDISYPRPSYRGKLKMDIFMMN